MAGLSYRSPMEKMLVSACLAGENTRYDGKNNEMQALIEQLQQYYDLVLFCPEVAGGLGTPRIPSEIRGNQVINEKGKDVTSAFLSGAQEALRLCDFFQIKVALLKDGSPSCGSSKIYDGSFSHRKKDGMGVTAQLLSSHGVTVYNEESVATLLEGLKRRDQVRAERDRIRIAKSENEVAEQEQQERQKRPQQTRKLHEERERRPYSHERKPYGDKKPRGDRKSFGDRKPYGKIGDHKGPKGPYKKKPFKKRED